MEDRFMEIYQQSITRPGADKLLAWLETTDFFEAPASTRFHLSRPGGLVEHSIYVYKRLCSLVNNDLRFQIEKSGENWADTDYPHPSEETIAICGLLHGRL